MNPGEQKARRVALEEARTEYAALLDRVVNTFQAALNNYAIRYVSDFRMHRDQVAMRHAKLSDALAELQAQTEPLRRGFVGRLKFAILGR